LTLPPPAWVSRHGLVGARHPRPAPSTPPLVESAAGFIRKEKRDAFDQEALRVPLIRASGTVVG
jgi:hypothetical protein